MKEVMGKKILNAEWKDHNAASDHIWLDFKVMCLASKRHDYRLLSSTYCPVQVLSHTMISLYIVRKVGNVYG